MNDSDLLDRLREGDARAFDSIFREHYPHLVSFAGHMLRDHAAGEEIAQDVMVELWRRHASLEVRSSLRAYLVRAARNRCLNDIRHRRIRRKAEPLLVLDATPVAAADAGVATGELEAALRDAVAALPERCREVFELSRVRGLRYAEIADAMEISVKTVEAQMGKALRLLRERLAPWLPDADER